MVDFGTALRTLRKKSKMSQQELAEKLGLTKSIISYYELQSRTPSPEILVKLTRIFHVSSDFLLGIDSEEKRTLDVSDLTEDDIELLEYTARALRKKNSLQSPPKRQ